MLEKYKEKLLPILQQLYKFKFAALSLLVLAILSLTISQAQKVSESMLDSDLVDEKLLEIQTNKVEIDQMIFDEIDERVKNSAGKPQPVKSSTTNPFTFN